MQLVQEVGTLDNFRTRWIDPSLRRELIDGLVASGYPPAVIRQVDEKEEYDLYDVLAELGLGPKSLARATTAHRRSNTSTRTGLMGCRVRLLLPSALLPVSLRRVALKPWRTPGYFKCLWSETPEAWRHCNRQAFPQKLFTEAKRRMFTA